MSTTSAADGAVHDAATDSASAVLSAFERQGVYMDPGLLDEHLAEIADKAAGSLRRCLAGGEGGFAALSDLLTVTSALRVVLGFEPSATAKDVVAGHWLR